MQTDLQTNPAAGAFQPFASSMTVHYLADGDSGAHQSIDDMRGLVDRALKSPQIYQLARHLVSNVAPYDEAAELEALYHWALGKYPLYQRGDRETVVAAADTTSPWGQDNAQTCQFCWQHSLCRLGIPRGLSPSPLIPMPPNSFRTFTLKSSSMGIGSQWTRPGLALNLAYPRRGFIALKFSRFWMPVGNMPRLGDDSTTAADIASVIQATGQSAAQIIAASQGPYVLVNGQYVANPNYPGAVPVLQNTSQALGVPSIVLLGVGVWLLYTALKR